MNLLVDIFEELGIDAKFDSTGKFTCILQSQGSDPLLLVAYLDHVNRILKLSVTTHHEVPNTIHSEFFSDFASKAIEPFRDGIGIGVLEGAKNITVYQSVKTTDIRKEFIIITLESLVKEAENWNKKLAHYPDEIPSKRTDSPLLKPQIRPFSRF
ncbi:hypothetical protein [Vibrio hepatarius]|uniref:hypothetical protein n=1 Tax=Vibrio hepatarius TaxID=171383 RepID=UPI001C099500|nr:hypothetical protein [Vibrio hepatarius]MBU2898150.1 hypothetical protein [Vibrio hepatarius]